MAGTINKPRKPQSKRGITRLRHKIEKVVAAKQRKQRKLAKKNPEWRSKHKKDPGIPNSFPYKERILAEIEEERIRRKEDAQHRKEALKASRMEGAEVSRAEVDTSEHLRDEIEMDGADDGDAMDVDAQVMDDESNPMAALLASARKAAEQYEGELHQDDAMDEDDASHGGKSDGSGDAVEIQGGATSRKAYDKVFKQVVEQADVILYILDARDPERTRSREVERSVMAGAGGGKRLIFILNKIDLVPPPVLRGWLDHHRRYFPTLPLRASVSNANSHTFNHRNLTAQSSSAALFRALKSYAASRNLKRAISVGVIGYPNVGKSSVINALLARLSGARGQHSACPTGAEAGVTTAIRQVRIDSKLALLDSPGIVFSSLSSNPGGHGTGPRNMAEARAELVLLNALPPKHIDDPIPAVTLLLKRMSASPDLMQRLTNTYGLPPLLSKDSTNDFLVHVARRRGRLSRGGVPNLHAAAMTVITDWRDGRIQGWVEPPSLPVVADSAAAVPTAARGVSNDDVAMPDQKQIVSEWAEEFKLEGLWGTEQQY